MKKVFRSKLLLAMILVSGFLVLAYTYSANYRDLEGPELPKTAVDSAPAEPDDSGIASQSKKPLPSSPDTESLQPERQFGEIRTVHGYIQAVQNSDLVDDADLNHIWFEWLDACRKARDDGYQTGRWERRYGPSVRSKYRETLNTQCAEVLPEGFDGSQPLDYIALNEMILEYREAGSAWEKGRRLEESFSLGGKDQLAREAALILHNSLDTGSYVTAIRHLIRQGVLDISPQFGNVDIHMESYNFVRIVEDAATAIICDRTGGCPSRHPVLWRRCFDSPFGCDNPYDIHDAIYQLLSPMEHQVFSRILDETRLFMIRNPP